MCNGPVIWPTNMSAGCRDRPPVSWITGSRKIEDQLSAAVGHDALRFPGR
jgi:hypothetical protein